MTRINIAIDGYAGCGKSTLAKDLAKALNYIFVDSGAMYRGITLFLLEKAVDISNGEAVAAALSERPELTFAKGNNHLFLSGREVEGLIRGDQAVANKVSDVAALPAVRDYLKVQQEAFVAQKGVVMEGRDIGTVIMPAAELKLFITASIEERVKRRSNDLFERGKSVDDEAIRSNLQERDRKDATRAEAPLRKAEDAVAFDSTHFDRPGQLSAALAMARPLIDPEALLPFIQ
ncbi:MAG: (d)CMP kinase [Flavobacteriales bacterium]|nr:(d)CMP kinase [Flavobacteriales bacterium]